MSPSIQGASLCSQRGHGRTEQAVELLTSALARKLIFQRRHGLATARDLRCCRGISKLTAIWTRRLINRSLVEWTGVQMPIHRLIPSPLVYEPVADPELEA